MSVSHEVTRACVKSKLLTQACKALNSLASFFFKHLQPVVWRLHTGGAADSRPAASLSPARLSRLPPWRPTCEHELIGVVRDGEDVGRGLLALFASVGRDHLRVVHRQPLVGVDGDTEEARVGLRKSEHSTCGI